MNSREPHPIEAHPASSPFRVLRGPVGVAARTLLLAMLCLPWLGCSDDAPQEECIPGTTGCPCLEEGGCASDALLCILDTCRPPACDVGEKGCACFSNATCSQDDEGAWLWCDDGICRTPACPAGELGCGCQFDGTCDTGLLCSDAGGPPRCELPSCEPGEPGCGCRRDRTCADGPDGEELVCNNGRCTVPTCSPGAADCVCRADYGCDGSLRCNEQGRCAPPACAAGTAGCGCRADGTCAGDDLFCDDDGRCQVSDCSQGAEGCGCFPDFTCASELGGAVLVCSGGRCQRRSCEPGDTGCACTATGTCTSTRATCFEGRCVGEDCTPGSLGCPCGAGGACEVGAICENGTLCVDNTGFAGGVCFENQTCRNGNACDRDTGRCQPCSIGSPGCQCFDNRSCNRGLTCFADTCVDDAALRPAPPEDPVCWTPCSATALIDEGTLKECDRDGLTRGCLNGQECVSGTCLAPGEDLPTCEDDNGCPDFQTCLDGGCYANCESTPECAVGQVCSRRVCRFPCTTGGASCPEGMYCASTDGDTGYCQELTSPNGPNVETGQASFEIDEVALQFSTARDRASFQLTNTGAVPARFTVRKLSETITSTDGSVQTLLHRDASTPCELGLDCPLAWLEIGRPEDLNRVQHYEVTLAPGEEVRIVVRGAGETNAPRWSGELEVRAPNDARRRIALDYAAELDGQWSGQIVYFANFDDENLQEWASGAVEASEVPNAFVAGWDNFRRGRASLLELQAILTALRTDSWRFPQTESTCQQVTGDNLAACFPFDNADGVGVLTQNRRSQPVPSGVSELPMTVNLQRADASACGTGPGGASASCFQGRVESRRALHLPGNPEIRIGFASDPASCDVEGASGCINYLTYLSTRVAVGGRFRSTSPSCGSSRFQRSDVPWLVSAFFGDSLQAGGGGGRVLAECRDTALPLDEGSNVAARNARLATANPIPDGRSTVRTLDIIDGILVEKDTMVILFRERTRSFLDPDRSFTSYGYMTLSRQNETLEEEDFVGTVQSDPAPQPLRTTGGVCSNRIRSAVAAPDPAAGRGTYANYMARAMMDGVLVDFDALEPVGADEEVHYYCADTGLFNGGPGNAARPGPALECSDECATAGDGECRDGGSGSSGSSCAPGTDCTDCGIRYADDTDEDRVACPEGSQVIFFTLDPSSFSTAAVAGHPCQLDGSCGQTLDAWVANGRHNVRLDPIWSCTPVNVFGTLVRREVCDDDRRDLRWGRTFYSAIEENAVFASLEAAVDEAFRYRSQFTSTSGAAVGFVPPVCTAQADQDSFCFNPEAIEEIKDRVDCLVDLYVNYEDVLTPDYAASILGYLQRNFAFFEVPRPRMAPRTYDGFERLYAELLTTLGDEALTDAYQSRFDLAGSQLRAFEGSRFEPDGIDLSGQAGFEMVRLHEAVQAYGMVLDRFFSLTPALARSLDDETRNFITAATVTSYLQRVLGASSKRARAQGEIALRYRGLNRPDLARRTIEQAYTRTYLESVVISEMLSLVVDSVAPQERDQLRVFIEDTQRRFRVELNRMQEAYREMGNNINVFGFPEEYIPFPALGPADRNALELSLQRAWQRVSLAEDRENEALASDRSFNTDAASFQQELTRLKRSYDERLGGLCGTFRATVDGVERVYPAIPRYAHLDPRLRSFGNPCGLVGNGDLFEAAQGVEIQEISLRAAVTEVENLLEEIRVEEQRIESQCNLIFDRAQYVWDAQGRVNNMQDTIARLNAAIGGANRALSSVGTVAGLIKCTAGLSNSCPMAAAAIGVYVAGAVVAEVAIQVLDGQIRSKQNDINDIERATARYLTETECDALRIDGEARLQSMILSASVAELDILSAQKEVALAASSVERLHNESIRLLAEWDEAQQLLIDVAAAQTDPNVRIYRDSSVVNADDTFFRALREAYRATRVFEYYTSQSYARFDELFLVRMVNFGDFTLTNYLLDLEDAYRDFEEQFGNPDTRVAIVSLRDDILRIPRLDERSAAISRGQRVEALRERLTDPWLIDRDGYLNVPFNTRLNQLSPLTRNHKVLFIEAEIIGSDVGDPVGRVYLRQAGTGVVSPLSGDALYYIFPERTAVINTFFNGQRVFDPSVYRSERFRDRPFVNTRWEFIFNRKDEEVNRDINVQSLTDIRFYIYYTDFTRL